MFALRKKNTTPFVFSIENDQLQAQREEMSGKIALFQEMRDDFKNVLIVPDYEVFLAGGSIDSVEEKLQHAMLPNFPRQYVNIMASIKFIRLHDNAETEDKVAVKIFEIMISKKDGDIVDDLIETLLEREIAINFSKVSDITGMFFIGKRLSASTRDYSTPEKTQEGAYSTQRIDALFSMILEIASLLDN